MFDILGFDSNYKVPFFAAKVNYAQGPIEGAGELNVLLCGLPGTGGNLGVNSEIRQVFQQSDVDVAVQAGCQLSRQARSAFLAVPQGANIFICAPAQSSGVKSTFTVTITGTNTNAVTGQLTLHLGGVDIVVSVGTADAVATIATALANAMAGKPDCPFIGSPAAGVMTGTCIDPGAQGNDWVVGLDVSLLPSGYSAVLAGSSTLHNNENGVTTVFSGATLGSGVEDVTTILTKLTTKRWARIGAGQRDSSNAALWKAFVRQQLAPLVQKYNMVVFGFNGTQSGATSLAQTTLNDPNCQVVAMRYSEAHPAEIAAGVATLRAAVEVDDPVPDYDGMNSASNGDWSTFLPPNRFDSDNWLDAEANVLLNAGVTPVQTMGGAAKCTRAITSYCQLNGGQDERCLDIGDAVFPAYAAIVLSNLWWGQFRVANKYVRDNPLPQEPDPPSGVGYPNLWKSTLTKQLEEWFQNGWLQHTWDPADDPYYPVGVAFNKAAQRIQSAVNLVVSRVDHQLAQTINQTGPS